MTLEVGSVYKVLKGGLLSYKSTSFVDGHWSFFKKMIFL
jgi:hypothetical protein